jgi:hypothetical protein
MSHIERQTRSVASRLQVSYEEYLAGLAIGLKRCSGPDKHFAPLDQFGRNACNHDGLAAECRACAAQRKLDRKLRQKSGADGGARMPSAAH